MKKKLFSIIFSLILIFTCSCSNKDIRSNECLTVYFFDVGQADSSLLLFPDGTTVLIDAGNRADGEEIAGFIKNGGINTIDYFVCTHPHEDHIGGAEEIFEQFVVKTVCMPRLDDTYKPTVLYKNLLNSIKSEKSGTIYLSAGTVLLTKENYTIEALAPDKNSVYSDLNDYSLVLLVDFFTNTLLFTGDAENISENEILRNCKNIDADILKVGHHGSRDSSTKAFLNAVTPQVAIISSGVNNTYEHPHDEALNQLNNVGATVYRTDTVGTVIAKLYDGGFNIETDNSIELDGNK